MICKPFNLLRSDCSALSAKFTHKEFNIKAFILVVSCFAFSSFCAWVRVVREKRLLKGQDGDKDWLSLVSGGVLVYIYPGSSFCLFPLTDCVAFWRVECLGT